MPRNLNGYDWRVDSGAATTGRTPAGNQKERSVIKYLQSALMVLGVTALSGCANGPTQTVQSPSTPQAGGQISSQVQIPQLGVADNGTRLNLSSGISAQQSIYNIVAPLKEAERSYIAMATFFVADYNKCLKTGSIRVHSATRNQDRYRNLSPEGCFNNRSKIHQMANFKRRAYGKAGRPDENKRVKYFSLATGHVDKGWGSGEAWNRYAGQTGTASNGMTRTDIQTQYHAVMGNRADRIASDEALFMRDVLSNPLGTVLDTITPGS